MKTITENDDDLLYPPGIEPAGESRDQGEEDILLPAGVEENEFQGDIQDDDDLLFPVGVEQPKKKNDNGNK